MYKNYILFKPYFKLLIIISSWEWNLMIFLNLYKQDKFKQYYT